MTQALNDKPTRPILRYHGGKWKLAEWIISQFPEHRVYVEPFGGAGSVLSQKPRSEREVYNDINGETVNLFRVLRNPAQARELTRLVELTPYAREEHDLSFMAASDPIEQARRTLFRYASCVSPTGAQSTKWRTGFRVCGHAEHSRAHPASEWESFPSVIESFVQRLRGVVVENLPAIEMVEKYDNIKTLFYCDPPYAFESRNDRWAGRAYSFEMSDGDHRELAAKLDTVKAGVAISGYHCPLYDELYSNWAFVQRDTYADNAAERTEVLWLNRAAADRHRQLRLL